MELRNFSENNIGSAVPLILYVLTIFGVGALYTLLYLEVAIPLLAPLVPDSDSKVFILMGIYSLPLVMLVIGGVALVKSGLKKEVYV